MIDHLTIIICIVVGAYTALGAWVSMGKGMVLERIGTLLGRVPVISPALATCPACMCSVWGTLGATITGAMPYALTWIDVNVHASQVDAYTLLAFLCYAPFAVLAMVGFQYSVNR